MEIRIVSFNIHKGLSLFRRPSLVDIKRLLVEIAPDIVFIQEIYGDVHHSLGSQLEYLADSHWSEYSYGMNSVKGGGNYGNAILSKFPILSSKQFNLSTNRLEKRSLLSAEIEIEQGEIRSTLNLLTAHLNLMRRSRIKQFFRIQEILKEQFKGPLVLGGDLNDLYDDSLFLLKPLTEAFHHHQGQCAKSFPSLRPLLKLDKMFSQGIKIKYAELVNSPIARNCSDHLPLMVTYEYEV